MLVEVLLKLLVGKVDVELLESINFKVLEAKDVQDPDKLEVLLAQETVVDTVQDPTEGIGVEGHADRVPRVASLGRREGPTRMEQRERRKENIVIDGRVLYKMYNLHMVNS